MLLTATHLGQLGKNGPPRQQFSTGSCFITQFDGQTCCSGN